MNRKTLVVAAVSLVLLVVFGGGILWRFHITTQEMMRQAQETQAVQKGAEVQKQAAHSEIESVKDLIDGEYTFSPVDTSTWQTYRNEELGFEVKIPKDWEMRDIYQDEDKSADIWFSQKGKWYEFEGGSYNAIIISISFKTNPFFQLSESVLKSFKESHDNVSIGYAVINGVPFYYHDGFDEGIMTTASFPKNYSFALSSSLILDEYPEVRNVLRGMAQTGKVDGISSAE